MNSSRKEAQFRARQHMSGSAAADAMGYGAPTRVSTQKKSSNAPNYAAQNRQRIKALEAMKKAQALEEENARYLEKNRVNPYIGVKSRVFDNIHGTPGGRRPSSAVPGSTTTNENLPSARLSNPNAYRNVQEVKKQQPKHPHTLGTIPQYLQERKAQWMQEEEARIREYEEEQAKHRLVLMPEEERVRTLQTLLQRKNEVVTTMNRMRMSNDSEMARRRKYELEQQLKQIDSLIVTMSAKQVYVQPTHQQ